MSPIAGNKKNHKPNHPYSSGRPSGSLGRFVVWLPSWTGSYPSSKRVKLAADPPLNLADGYRPHRQPVLEASGSGYLVASRGERAFESTGSFRTDVSWR